MYAVRNPQVVLLSEPEVEKLRLDWGRSHVVPAPLGSSPTPAAEAADTSGVSQAANQTVVPPPAYSQTVLEGGTPHSSSTPLRAELPGRANTAPAASTSNGNGTPALHGRRLLRKAFAPQAALSSASKVMMPPAPTAPKFAPFKQNGPGAAAPPAMHFGQSKSPGPQTNMEPSGGFGFRPPSYQAVVRAPVPVAAAPVPHPRFAAPDYRNGKKAATVPIGRIPSAPSAAPMKGVIRKRERAPAEGDRSYPSGLAIVFDTSTLMGLERIDLNELLRENRLILPNVVVHELDEHNKRRRQGLEMERRAQKAVELRDWIASILEKPEDSHERRHLRLQRVEEVDETHYAQKRVQDDEIVACAVFFRNRYAEKSLDVYVATDDKILKIKCATEKLKTTDSAELPHWHARAV